MRGLRAFPCAWLCGLPSTVTGTLLLLPHGRPAPACGCYAVLCARCNPYVVQPTPPSVPHLLAQATGCSDAQAEDLVKQLSDSGRYHKDVW